MYWDINEILRYNRCFNFINGERSIGKTYTTQKFIMGRALNKDQQFVYIVRTQDEKKHGVFERAFEKVLMNEYHEHEIMFTTDECAVTIIDEDGNEEKKVLGFCVALSEALKIKKRSFPQVKYLMFDEYMLEDKQERSYIGGWAEPDFLLSIYHTIDRQEDRVICLLLGNNTNFYNPYHLHPAFKIPKIEQGKIWCSENVLFQWAKGSERLKEAMNGSRFVRMIQQTSYGQYSTQGKYIYENNEFIAPRSGNARHYFIIGYRGDNYGIWVDRKAGKIYVSEKYDPSCRMHFALTLDDHTENTLLTKDKKNTMLKWLGDNFKRGVVYFESEELKAKTEGAFFTFL